MLPSGATWMSTGLPHAPGAPKSVAVAGAGIDGLEPVARVVADEHLADVLRRDSSTCPVYFGPAGDRGAVLAAGGVVAVAVERRGAPTPVPPSSGE